MNRVYNVWQVLEDTRFYYLPLRIYRSLLKRDFNPKLKQSGEFRLLSENINRRICNAPRSDMYRSGRRARFTRPLRPTHAHCMLYPTLNVLVHAIDDAFLKLLELIC